MKNKCFTAAAALPLSLILSWGAVNALVTGMNLPVEAPGLLFLIWALCALAGCVIFSLPNSNLTALAVILVSAFWLWNIAGISLPIRALITRLSIVYDSAYQWGVLEFAAMDWKTTSLDLLLEAWGGIIAFTAAGAVIRGRGGLVSIGLALLAAVPTVVVNDTPPDALPLACLLFASALLLMTRSVARQDPGQGALLAALAAVPTAALIGCLLLACPQDSYVNKAQERLDAISAWWQDTFASPGKTGSLGQQIDPTPTASASTRLGSLGPRRVVPYKVMEVESGFDGTLYLRGRDYDVYDGLSWTSTADRTEVLEKSPSATHRGTVTVTTLRPLDVVYIPSYPSQNYALTGGCLQNPDDGREFFWSVSRIPLEDGLIRWMDGEDPNALRPYLQLPKSTRDWADDYVDELLDTSYHLSYNVTSTIAQVIIDHVGNSARYSLNTPRMDGDYEDFAQWFLEESDKGYCVHFATAATVLLRAAGIPARYVTGYMVTCKAGETVAVSSDRAHAWVEYYDENSRTWIIAEPTPADLSEDETEPPSVTAPPPVTEAPTADGEETTAPTQADATRPTDSAKPDKPEKKSPALVRILLWLLTWGALVLTVILQRLVRIALRRRMHTGGPNRRALGLWLDVERISALLGRPAPEELLALAQKARFSQHKLTREELHAFTLWLRDARRTLRQEPLLRRLWSRYVLALW